MSRPSMSILEDWSDVTCTLDEIEKEFHLKEFFKCPELKSKLVMLNIKITNRAILLLLTLENQFNRFWIENLLDDLSEIINHYSFKNKEINIHRAIIINIDPRGNDRQLIEESLRTFSARHHEKNNEYDNTNLNTKIYLY
jgi:hypothetical protein